MNAAGAIIAVLPRSLREYVSRVKTSPIGYRLAGGAFWSLAGSVISRGLTILSGIVVARLLGKNGYGELGIVLSTAGMFQAFAGFGLGLTATKFVAQFRKTDPQRAGRILAVSALVAAGTGLVCTVVLYVLAPWLASETLDAPHLARLVRIGSVMLLLGASNGAQSGALAGFEAFRTIARISVLTSLVTLPLMVGGVLWLGLEGAAWASVASLSVNWLLNHLALRGEAHRDGIPLQLAGCFRESRILWTFSLPAMLSGIMVSPVVWLCNVMLVNQPGGYGQMGLFNAASQWRTAVLFLPSQMMSVLLPVLSSFGNQSGAKDPRYATTLRMSYKVIELAVLPTIGVLCLLVGPLTALYGKGFPGLEMPMAALMFSAGVMALGGVSGSVLQAKGALWLGFGINTVWGVLMIGGFQFVLAPWGALGLAMDYALSYFLLTILLLIPMSLLGAYPTRLAIRTVVGCLVLIPICAVPVLIPGNLRFLEIPALVVLAGVLALRLHHDRA